MYNIALCFYGEARNWQQGAATVDKFNKLSQEKFNIDVYVHLWDDITRRFDVLAPNYEKRFLKLIKENNYLDEVFVVESNLQHEELLRNYKPINYKIENKSVLDEYIDKFKPSDDCMSCEEIKRAIKYSNTPCFSQLYSMSQSFHVIEEKDKYDMIIIQKADCQINDKSVTDKILKHYCNKVSNTNKNYLFVEAICLRCKRQEVWIHHGYMMACPRQFGKLFNNFPKIPIGMGVWSKYKWRGHSHAEFGDYVLSYSNINRVQPIGSQFAGKFKQFIPEVLTEVQPQLGTKNDKYIEYINLQKEKTTDPVRRKKWLSTLWPRFLTGFKKIFNKHIDYIGDSCLCIGARTGQEVQALIDLNRDAIGIDLVAHEPLVIEGDFHNLNFNNNSFDFIFSNVIDHALYPSKFCSEIIRVLKPGGVVLLHLQVNIPSDKYGVFDIKDIQTDLFNRLPTNTEVIQLNDIFYTEFSTHNKEVLIKKI